MPRRELALVAGVGMVAVSLFGLLIGLQHWSLAWTMLAADAVIVVGLVLIAIAFLLLERRRERS
jgi:hypothetical protein